MWAVLLLAYVPVLYWTLRFVWVSQWTMPHTAHTAHTAHANHANHANHTVHQILIPYGPTPPLWTACARTWTPRWRRKQWDADMCRHAIMEAMPHRRELLDYEGVMFTDVCRSAIMYTEGGVYADMDICATPKTTLPDCDACFVHTSMGVSTDMMLARRHHPVFLNILHQYADARWVTDVWLWTPYIRTMFSTGPAKLTLAIHKYPEVRVIEYPNVQHIRGNTWHGWDVVVFVAVWRYGWIVGCLFLVSKRYNLGRVLRKCGRRKGMPV